MSEAFGLWFGGSHMGFGTHMPILAAAVLGARPGPVLEYGMGLYSSPLLHMLCEEQGRDLLSLDGDPPWAERFDGLRAGPRHTVVGVEDWDLSEPFVDEWLHGRDPAVVFIDHGPDERRVVDARRVAHLAELVLVHDWGQPPLPSQVELASMFQYQWTSRVGPFTCVLSNVRPFVMPGLQ